MVNVADYPEELLESRFKGDTPDQRPESNPCEYSGLIAQEVEELLNKLNQTWSGHHISTGKGNKQSLSYSTFTMPLIKSIQQMNESIQQINESVQQMNDRLIAQENNITQLNIQIAERPVCRH